MDSVFLFFPRFSIPKCYSIQINTVYNFYFIYNGIYVRAINLRFSIPKYYKVSKVHPCTGTEALYRPYGQYGQ